MKTDDPGSATTSLFDLATQLTVLYNSSGKLTAGRFDRPVRDVPGNFNPAPLDDPDRSTHNGYLPELTVLAAC
jgi:hypothetical protein